MIILNYTTTIHGRFVFQMTILSVKAFSTLIKNLILKVISKIYPYVGMEF